MRLVRAGSSVDAEADLLILPLVEGAALPATARDVDRALGGVLGDMVNGDFKGRFAEIEATRSLSRVPAGRVALLGLGKAEQLDLVRLGNALQIGLRSAIGGARTIAVGWAGTPAPGISATDVAAAAVAAGVLVGWAEATHKSGPHPSRQPKSLTLAGFPDLDQRRLDAAQVLAEATNLARDLVNRPGSDLTPLTFAAEARTLARRYGFDYEVLGAPELKRRGYAALLAAGAGSAIPPRMVILRHAPQGPGRPRLALVGKGVTFDSGGISIKPAADMRFMRGDMGGAAAVLGAMTAIARLKLDADVIGILCCAENMLSGTSMRPGDVVGSGAGKTIEVVSTDAEGRMALADGIHHAVKLGATHVLDIATLTGGQRIALGPVAAMVQGSDPGFTARLVKAAAAAGERVWEMPTFPEYETQLDSTIADLNNSPGADASAITAGLFLREFSAGLPWVHVDMAAPSWNRVAGVKQIPGGPAGFGVRTLAHLAMGMAPATKGTAPRAKSDKTGRK
ncbi:MAG TPA: M17 family peptidase N-terminal domain-containing protein [Candidatus Dormibacteraeota bacterium]|nr:M17 family peptidase N-terminal domain-containing protein [Candidatus Dormibacteraeota bacterium]